MKEGTKQKQTNKQTNKNKKVKENSIKKETKKCLFSLKNKCKFQIFPMNGTAIFDVLYILSDIFHHKSILNNVLEFKHRRLSNTFEIFENNQIYRKKYQHNIMLANTYHSDLEIN